jgi:hypothetical protein
VNAAAAEVEASAFYGGLTSALAAALLPPGTGTPLVASIRKLVIYGLGSLEEPVCAAAHIKCQLALATLLAAALPGLDAKPEAFDPVFTSLDRALLPLCGIDVIGHDEEGRRVALQPTFFWLPHCDSGLIDALLSANVETGTLHNVVILGNLFSTYVDRFNGYTRRMSGWGFPARLLELCVVGAVVEMPVSDQGFRLISAFNDMGLMTFRNDWRERLEGTSGGDSG